MDISVIIPTYNRQERLLQALQSVLQQTYPAREIIIVDDGSSDDTRQRLRPYRDQITYLRQDANEGVSKARNRGIQEASGDWIAFLDSDDIWDRRKLELQKAFHDEHPGLMISQCDEIWVRNNTRVNPMNKHAKQAGWIFPACLPLCIVSPSAIIIHASVFESQGGFDETLPACEDYDLWLRLSRYYKIGLLPQKLVTRYGGHDDQLSRKYWGMDRFRIRALEKHIKTGLQDEWYRPLLEELVFKCGVVARGALKRANSSVAKEYAQKEKTYRRFLAQQFPD